MSSGVGVAELMIIGAYLGFMALSIFVPIAYGVWLFLNVRNIRREIAELRLEIQDSLRSKD